MARSESSQVSRRDFARLLALGGAAPLLASGASWWPGQKAPAMPAPSTHPDEKFWTGVRAQFVMPPDLGMLNAANLCPSSAPVLDAVYRMTRDIDQDPSADNRAKFSKTREDTRNTIAEFLRVSPEEILITRNTSEANNFVSTGLDLKPGDEVLIFEDNHPSNNTAWKEKAKRFGYTVKVIPQVNPHPGFDHYVDTFAKAITPQTKVLTFTHLTSTVGDLFPAKDLCRVARERGVLTLMDGAQSFGLINVDLSDVQPDFYSGSSHKWPCGPKEVGVLYVNRTAQPKLWGSIFSAYPGAVGISKHLEAFGQRDDAAIAALGEALRFQTKIGRANIEARSKELTQALLEGLRRIDGVQIWTSPEPSRSLAIVSFQVGTLDAHKLATALYQNDRIGCATRGGKDRPGLRFSPHFYNTHAEVDRAVAAVKKYAAAGV
jgi:selenocysteine lyase/cysteine desulfurase